MFYVFYYFCFLQAQLRDGHASTQDGGVAASLHAGKGDLES